jgi:small-conductance mechanosensitive channel
VLEPWLAFAIVLVIAIVVAVAATAVISLMVRTIARRREWPKRLVQRARRAFRVLILLVALWVACTLAFPDRDWMALINHVMLILVIAASAWLLAALVLFSTDLALGRYRIDVPDNRVARRIRTQMLIVRRLLVAIIIVIAAGAILLTFPAVQAIGASVLASAGIASIVAGLAAQSVLANMFAGLQLAFSEAIRVDDVVVVEGEWGRIGEITLSYVVVKLWDERRLVLPCTYFTTQPFENWTRQGSELLGAVELDLDWRVSPARMREHLTELVENSSLWDGRTAVLQVTDATGGVVRVRILVSALDAPTLFDLRCLVREEMVSWVQSTIPSALPVQRVLMTEPDGATDAPAEDDGRKPRREPVPDTGGLFTGSREAEERASEFTQAVPVHSSEDARQGDAARDLPR